MALTDPQSVTINAVPYSMARISTDATKSVYATSDGNVKMTVSHQTSKDRARRMVRIDKRIIAADPLTAENAYLTASVYVVIDEPSFGFADADLDYIVQGFKTWLSTGNVTAVLGAQH